MLRLTPARVTDCRQRLWCCFQYAFIARPHFSFRYMLLLHARHCVIWLMVFRVFSSRYRSLTSHHMPHFSISFSSRYCFSCHESSFSVISLVFRYCGYATSSSACSAFFFRDYWYYWVMSTFLNSVPLFIFTFSFLHSSRVFSHLLHMPASFCFRLSYNVSEALYFSQAFSFHVGCLRFVLRNEIVRFSAASRHLFQHSSTSAFLIATDIMPDFRHSSASHHFQMPSARPFFSHALRLQLLSIFLGR